MKKLKLDLQHLKSAEVLTRSQLKNVLGGDPPVTGGGGIEFCHISTSCDLYVRQLEQTYTGSCFYQIFGKCYCSVVVNGQTYSSDPDQQSVCYR